MDIDNDTFEEVKGDADSLAGLILEITGKLPKQNREVVYENFVFNVLSVSDNRIEQVKITITENDHIHKIDFPEKNYQNSNIKHCPFSFEYPTYTTIEQDSLFFNEKVENPCWMDIKFNDFKGVLHMSYKAIQQKDDFAKGRRHCLRSRRRCSFIGSVFFNRYQYPFFKRGFIF